MPVARGDRRHQHVRLGAAVPLGPGVRASGRPGVRDGDHHPAGPGR
ncbi:MULTISPECIES: hypothetical protein [unclassified Actinoplanes]|nr:MULTISPECIES: hypothetical protein [unclassified Actinoplanes]